MCALDKVCIGTPSPGGVDGQFENQKKNLFEHVPRAWGPSEHPHWHRPDLVGWLTLLWLLMLRCQHSTLSLRLAHCHTSLWFSKQLPRQKRVPLCTMAAAVAAPANISQLIDDINSKYEKACAPAPVLSFRS